MFGNLLFLHRFFLLLLLFLLLFSLRFCPTKFSETDNPIFTKLHWKVDPHLQKVHSGLGIFKMAANIKIQKIVKNSKMKRFQWKWIYTGSKTCCTIWQPFWSAMAAILNQNKKILRFGRTLVSMEIMMLRIDIHRWFAMAAILNPKWSPKYQNPPIWKKFDFQVDYDVAN